MPRKHPLPAESPVHVSLGLALVALREQQAVTLRRVAAASGLAKQQLRGIEAGTIDPSFAVLDRIAAGIDQPLSQIIARFETEEYGRSGHGHIRHIPLGEQHARERRAQQGRLRPSPLSETHACLGRALRLKRTHIGIDACELGGYSRLGLRFVLAIERGRVDPTFGELLALASPLGCPLSILLASAENHGYDFDPAFEDVLGIS